MTTYNLYLEIPRSDSMHLMQLGETTDYDDAERWCSGKVLSRAQRSKMQSGYMLTAKHNSLGLKTEQGCDIEQVACFGRFGKSLVSGKVSIATCTSTGAPFGDTIVVGFGLTEKLRVINKCWLAERPNAHTITSALMDSKVITQLAVMAVAKAIAPEVDRFSAGMSRRDIPQLVEARARGEMTTMSSLEYPSAMAAIFLAKGWYDMAVSKAFESARLHGIPPDVALMSMGAAIKSVVTLPDVAYAAIVRDTCS